MYFTIFLFFTITILGKAKCNHDIEDSTYCKSFNVATCNDPNKENCITQEKCGPAGTERHNHCFTLWEFNIETGASKVQMMGCFLNNKDCYAGSHCVEKNKDQKNQLYFCCCNGNLCNKNFTYEKLLENRQQVTLSVKKSFFITNEEQMYILILVLFIFTFIISLSFFIWYYHHQKLSCENELSKIEKGENFKQQSSIHKLEEKDKIVEMASIVEQVELLEKKAEGRFGTVWKARRGDETVAVKVLPLSARQSWQTELKIFQLPLMDNENVLHFVGAAQISNDLDTQFWIVTAYYGKGSLNDYLTENIITWNEMLDIALSIARGLNHLHQEISSSDKQNYKPAVAHRDFKSTNVLLSGTPGNIRACVADFGLALVFQADMLCTNQQHGCVGTLRYMAPELLDGAINFNKKAFLAIDMYACGLVFWELVSRCAIEEEFASTYQLPFEKEIGLQPNLIDMLECVVQQKRRPHIPETWKTHSGLSSICNTIEECWDEDADARLSASCVIDRISSLKDKNVNNCV